MQTFSVSALHLAPIEVAGENWIVALGRAFARLGIMEDVSRLACERLPNGHVIARDVGGGSRFVVRVVDEADRAQRLQVSDLLEQTRDPRFVAIDTALDAKEACRIALRVAQDLVPVESGSVVLREATGQLRFTAVSGPRCDRLLGMRMPPGTGVAGYSIQRGRTIIVGDTAKDPRHCGDLDGLTGYRTKDLACVPVFYGRQVVGAIQVLNLPAGEHYSRTHLRELRGVALALGQRLGEGVMV